MKSGKSVLDRLCIARSSFRVAQSGSVRAHALPDCHLIKELGGGGVRVAVPSTPGVSKREDCRPLAALATGCSGSGAAVRYCGKLEPTNGRTQPPCKSTPGRNGAALQNARLLEQLLVFATVLQAVEALRVVPAELGLGKADFRTTVGTDQLLNWWLSRFTNGRRRRSRFVGMGGFSCL